MSIDDRPAEVTTRSHGRRLTDLATSRGADVAIHYVPLEVEPWDVTYAQLEHHANQVARVLRDRGVGPQTLVALGVPSHPDHISIRFGAWKLGACVLPISHRMPASERQNLIDLADQHFEQVVSVGEWADGQPPTVAWSDLRELEGVDDAPLPDVVPEPAHAIASGGTTGTPKITLSPGRGEVAVDEHGEPSVPPGLMEGLGLHKGHVQMVCTPLYHTSGFGWSLTAITLGNPLVLLEQFQAELTLDAIERYRVQHTMYVPAVLQRMLEVPDIDERDLSSYVALNHGGAPCPDWVKRRWIDLVGPENLYEGMGATEAIGATVIRGDEWLERPGTVGRPLDTEVRILDVDQRSVRTGMVGYVYMRPVGATEPQFRYLGADYTGVTDDGFVTLGDLGWLDGDGYLYIADRRVDLIISGGSNVYPAEVENVLGEHPGVREAAVIGIPDERWGRRVHAVLVPRERGDQALVEKLDAYAREHLTAYKVPKSYEFVDELPYSDVGKLRRRPLVEAREHGTIKGEIRPGT
ncbi:MAG TPA: AMP-binding protein [Nitriliruptorales bacterium]